MEFPNEILLVIFNHLDTGNLNVAGQVCKRWAEIVQVFHDKARVDDRFLVSEKLVPKPNIK